ncbi:hypothetical protein OIU79_012251 [Salix purpurea]|uniref:Uncharacterized protein n=1 Tax=Salix purpurea TaxID=77065 RepID=A0A9Q0Q2W7_SALPP|nr:hypothetical protein OIU79_012251 [Salix purpurea]
MYIYLVFQHGWPSSILNSRAKTELNKWENFIRKKRKKRIGLHCQISSYHSCSGWIGK